MHISFICIYSFPMFICKCIFHLYKFGLIWFNMYASRERHHKEIKFNFSLNFWEKFKAEKNRPVFKLEEISTDEYLNLIFF